jgi:hypothetical protein
MSIDEFRSANRLASRKLTVAIIVILIPWFAILIAIVASYKSEAVSALSFVLGLVAASALCVPLWFMSRALARKHALTCPHCSYWFIGAYAIEALRTGRCPKCKQGIFSNAQQSARLCEN